MAADRIAQDLTYAARTLRRNPAYAIVVILTLALGIAANTTVFSVMNPYFVRALPFGEPERLVQLGQVDPVTGWDAARFSLPQYVDWKERTRAFDDIAAYHYRFRNLTGAEGPERVQVGVLTENMFDVLRADALLGRTFAPGEGGPGGKDVLVLGHGIWQRRYGGDPDVVGRTVELDGIAHTVIGIMPPEFNFPFGGVKLWVPMRIDPATEPRDRTNHILLGRLQTGWTAERAREELVGIQRSLAETYPEADGRYTGVTVRPMREALNFAYDLLRTGFLVLMAAVGLVLLIACVNVASLALARASGRAREVAIRTALGARRGRLVRQLLTESTLLALAGGILGVLLSAWAVGSIGSALPEDLYRVGSASIDRTVLLFTLAVTLGAPVLFGLAPALTATRPDLTAALKAGSTSGGPGRGALRGRRALVVAEVAFAVVLLCAAGLMVRSLIEIRQLDLGFRADRLLTVEVTPSPSAYPSDDAVSAYYARATAQLAAVPGVTAAATVYPLPLNHENIPIRYLPAEAAGTAPEDWPIALQTRITPGYLEAMGIPLLAGRGFARTDGPDAERVVLVSRALAERHWPGRGPVGLSLRVGEPGSDFAATVVGVVDDVVHTGLATPVQPTVYLPQAQVPTRRRFFVAATAAPPGTVAALARRSLLALDPDLPFTVRPMSEIVRESDIWAPGSVALGTFGALALVLAALGVYGLIAYSAARRRRELGIRLALGASVAQLRRLIVGEGLRLTLVGLAVGLALALAAGRVLASLLFGVSAADPLTFAAVPVLFLGIAVLASALPARRAAQVEPASVLREE